MGVSPHHTPQPSERSQASQPRLPVHCWSPDGPTGRTLLVKGGRETTAQTDIDRAIVTIVAGFAITQMAGDG